MKYNQTHFTTPQFHILSDKQLESLHLRTLEVMERVGVRFECQEALDLLGDAGADVSNPNRVRIPSYLVENALRTAPKSITLYTREGEVAFVMDRTTGAHFGSITGFKYMLDPYTRQIRPIYVEDIARMARLGEALPNIDWVFTTSAIENLPGSIADKVTNLQVILNNSKPVGSSLNDVESLKEMLKVASIIAGGEDKLRAKPFFMGSSEPVSPVVQGENAMKKSLLCAEKGIPNFVYSMPMAGATVPATFAGALVTAAADSLSQLAVLQLKKPGAPVIFGSLASIMDMRATIFTYGAPEMSLLIGALTELSHYYGLPMFGTAGATDSCRMDAQAAAETTYQCFVSAMTGADLIHDVGLMYAATTESPELVVFVDEVVDMLKILMRGIDINEETIPMDLMERVGPGGNYLAEPHTLKHFRQFWVPTIFDRSREMSEIKFSADRLQQKTTNILETYEPKPLPEDVLKEVQKIEASWFKQVGLEYTYPKRK